MPAPSEEAVRYYETGNVLWWVNTAWGLAVPAAIAFTGLSARMRTLARAVGRRWFFTVVGFYALYTVVVHVLDGPLAYYGGFVRPHAYGLSDQTFAKWLGDWLKGLGVSVAVGCLVIWVPYLLMRKSPARWWLWTGLLAVPFIFLSVMVAPVLIDPLFHRFGEMQDKELEAKILALARRAGIDDDRVYEVNMSDDTKTVNAYVTGLAGTHRIVLWDTLLREPYTDRQVLFIMGHEMGHYVLGHIVQGCLLGALGTLVALYLIHRLAGWLIVRFRSRLGFAGLADAASLPLILLLVGVLQLIGAPVVLAYSRHIEHEADRFGLEITRDNHAAAMAFVNMQHTNLSVPRPGWLFKLWRASHPTLGERIDFCNDYRPWETGQPLKYANLFHGP